MAASMADSGEEPVEVLLAASREAAKVAALVAQVVVTAAVAEPAAVDTVLAATRAAALKAAAMEAELSGAVAMQLVCLVGAEQWAVRWVALAALVATVAHTRAAQLASSSEIDPPAGPSRTARCSRRRTAPQTALHSPVPSSPHIDTPRRSSCRQMSHRPIPQMETATPGTLDRRRDCKPPPCPQECHPAPARTPMHSRCLVSRTASSCRHRSRSRQETLEKRSNSSERRYEIPHTTSRKAAVQAEGALAMDMMAALEVVQQAVDTKAEQKAQASQDTAAMADAAAVAAGGYTVVT